MKPRIDPGGRRFAAMLPRALASALFAGTLVAGTLVAGTPALVARADDDPVGTKSTMWADPYMIGSYRHMDEIYPARRVARAGPVSALPAGAPLALDAFWFEGRRIALEDYAARARTAGLVVLKDGKLVFERYWQGADAGSRFASWSMAKSVVSTLVGFALGDGLIRSLDDPISDYLPELKGTGYDGVPIKAVLQMSSGVAFTEDYDSPSSDSARLWREVMQYNKRPLTDFLLKAKRAVAPYAKFNYAGLDTAALGWLVERVTGKTLADGLAAKLWGPLGMGGDASWLLDDILPGAHEVPFCCINARLRDYARFGLFMAQGGAWDGRQLLPPGWVAEATWPDRPQVAHGALYPGYPMGYQYQWWSRPGPDHAFAAEGINGQFLYVDPAQRLVIAMASVWPGYWDSGLEKESWALFDAIAAVAGP